MAVVLKKEDVNRYLSVTWVKCNDDGLSRRWRRKFIEIFGGEFSKDGKEWKWVESLPEPEKVEASPISELEGEKTSVSSKDRVITVTRPDGTTDEVSNFTKYCRENKLNKSAMYEVMKGNRNHHKGYKAKKGD